MNLDRRHRCADAGPSLFHHRPTREQQGDADALEARLAPVEHGRARRRDQGGGGERRGGAPDARAARACLHAPIIRVADNRRRPSGRHRLSHRPIDSTEIAKASTSLT
jgi:hypothetical protein